MEIHELAAGYALDALDPDERRLFEGHLGGCEQCRAELAAFEEAAAALALAVESPVPPPDLVIADIARVDPEEVADAYPDIPILGYANHTDTSGLRRAHKAGFDQVVVKAALTERAQQLVEELTASVE